MSGWRHVWSSRGYAASVCVDHADGELPCGCTTPTPDPASPCGAFVGRVRCYWNHGIQTSADDEVGHPHQPTRCLTCHHEIEATP